MKLAGVIQSYRWYDNFMDSFWIGIVLFPLLAFWALSRLSWSWQLLITFLIGPQRGKSACLCDLWFAYQSESEVGHEFSHYGVVVLCKQSFSSPPVDPHKYHGGLIYVTTLRYQQHGHQVAFLVDPTMITEPWHQCLAVFDILGYFTSGNRISLWYTKKGVVFL